MIIREGLLFDHPAFASKLQFWYNYRPIVHV